ncbi:retrovirus-related pol polyprotein from transposon TNT 1-94 [Tanacetum coccineum]
MDSNFTNENDPWEYSLDIDDSDLHLTHVLRSSSSAHVEPSPYTPNPVTIIPGPAGVVQLSNSICVEPSSSTPNPVRIIPGPAGLVQRAKLLKENVFILDPDGALMSTQEYMQKVVEDVGEDADFNSGAWVSATNYVNAFGGTVTGCLGDIDNFLKKGKLEQVVAIVKSCSPNALGDLNVTLKDLSGTVPGTIHYKVLDVGSYEKDITVGAAMILANVLVFTPKPSKHYLNITKRNVVEVFRKDTILMKNDINKLDSRTVNVSCDVPKESTLLLLYMEYESQDGEPVNRKDALLNFEFSKRCKEVIVNGDAPTVIASASAGTEGHIPSKTVKQKLARKNELKAKALYTLSMNDLYNNLKVYESEIKGQSSTSSNSQNVAFVSSNNTSSTNEADNCLDVIFAIHRAKLLLHLCCIDVRLSFFANQSNSPQLDNGRSGEDLSTMILMRWISNGRALRNQGNRNKDNTRRIVPVETPANALVISDRIGLSSSSSSDTELKEALKEKDDLKLKLENFKESSKNLTRLINSQLSAKDKTSLGYDGQMNESELNNVHMNESELVHSVFNSRDNDVDDNLVNDIFKTCEGFHAVPPTYTGNYMPPRPDLSFAELDDSVFKSVVSETITSVPETETSAFKTSKESMEKSKTVRSSAPLIEESTVNGTKPSSNVFHKAHSPVRRPFNQKLAAKSNSFKEEVNAARFNNVTTAGPKAVVNAAEGNRDNVVKSSACWIWRPKGNLIDHISKDSGSYTPKRFDYGNPQYALQDQGIFDSGCSRHMTGNKFYLSDYQEIDGGFVAFGGSPKGGKITRKGKIRTGKLDFEDTECLILSPDFKLLDESQVLLKVPRQNNMYSFDLKNVVPSGGIENQINHRVKVIRCDNRTEFKNSEMNQFCQMKENKREFSIARTPQQNGADAINTACYVQNRVLITKPHNKTHYELLIGRPPNLDFMRPFGCPVTMLNTLNHLGKFEGKADEGLLVEYSINSKAFRVFNTRTRKVEENSHIKFLENKSNIAGSGPEWLFDIDSLTKSMNYESVTVGNQTNGDAGIETNVMQGTLERRKHLIINTYYYHSCLLIHHSLQVLIAQMIRILMMYQAKEMMVPSINTANTNINTSSLNINTASPIPNDPSMTSLEETDIFDNAYDDEDVGAEADHKNLETTMNVSHIPTTRIHKDHPKE